MPYQKTKNPETFIIGVLVKRRDVYLLHLLTKTPTIANRIT